MNLEVNIKDFGAQEKSSELQTLSIQKAIDHCFEQGGGTVVIPEGTFMSGDIRVRSNVTLYLKKGAVLKGSQNSADYFNHLEDKVEPLREDQISHMNYGHFVTIPPEIAYGKNSPKYETIKRPACPWNNALIRAIDAENIAIIGEEGSVIDGSNCFDETGEELYRGPHGITLCNCQNVTLQGYTIQNTGNWAHNIRYSDNIKVKNITALAGHDGIHFSVCKNITITDSEFYTGDDCIAGFANVNVYVSGCTVNSSCSAFRFGGSNVYVEKCNIYGPGKYCFRGSLTADEKRRMVPSAQVTAGRNNMLSAFTYYADFSLPIDAQPGNIVLTDCSITNADRFLHYNYSGNETWQKNRPLKNIEFRNINATGVCMPLTAYGDKDVKVDLTMENVNIEIKQGSENINLMHLCNFGKVVLENVKVENLESGSVIRAWSKGDVTIRGCEGFDVNNAVAEATEPFKCQAI